MKKAVAFASLLLSSTSASAELVNAPNVTAPIPSMMRQYGVSHLRMVFARSEANTVGLTHRADVDGRLLPWLWLDFDERGFERGASRRR
jgi:hypothetical protein